MIDGSESVCQQGESEMCKRSCSQPDPGWVLIGPACPNETVTKPYSCASLTSPVERGAAFALPYYASKIVGSTSSLVGATVRGSRMVT